MKRPRKGRVVEFALDIRHVRPPEPRPGEMLFVVLRARGRIVGRMTVDGAHPLDLEAFLRAARATAKEGLDQLEAGDGIVDVPGRPKPGDVSVVIATRNRPSELRTCLERLRELVPGPGEIVVADSASDDAQTIASLARAGGARLVRCDRPGLSRARNAGARVARGPILAFLDDDCRVDAGWLRGILAGFEDPQVSIVTGAYLPLELDTEAQLLFLAYAHMDRRGFAHRRFAPDRPESKHWPLDVWRMGSGGNLAVRAESLRARGGFREDLGLGTAASGGEDLFFLWSTLRDGGHVVYRSDAMVWHHHHRGHDALRRVMYGYGVGHRAYLRAAVRAGASPPRVAFYRASVAYDRVKRALRAVASGDRRMLGLVLSEAAGSLAAARLARRAQRRDA